MKLAENLTYFAENTSIHGLVQIAKASSSVQKRLIWLVIFVLSMIYAGTQIAEEAKCKHITEVFLQCCLYQNHQDPIFVVNWHFSTCPDRCKSADMLFFNLSVNRYSLGLSNELLFIIIAQEAPKL